MNLKQAAQRLAVHYQTAYRWVRSGELTAVKIGNRYEVSEAAIQQFLSRRADLILDPADGRDHAGPEPVVGDDGAAMAELRILARETRATAQPCFDAATALVGSLVGDAAILRLLDETGQALRPVSSFAGDPELRARLVGAADAAGSFPRDTPHWSAVERSGDIQVVHHMPQDLMLDLMGEAGRFTARGLRVLAAAVAPMFSEDEFVGGVVALQTQAARPFRDDQLDLLRIIGRLCGEAHQRAGRFVRSWEASSELRERVATWLVGGGDPAAGTEAGGPGPATVGPGPGASGAGLLIDERAQAIAAPDGSLVAWTPRFAQVARLSEIEPTEPGALARRWVADGIRDVIHGASTQTELDPQTPDYPTVIVSAARGADAGLQVLAIDAIDG